MVDLPQPIPNRIKTLPRDERGFPVPWFVQWFDNGEPSRHGVGKPDFRVMDIDKFALALKHPHCWVCGEVLGRVKVFTIGPMCCVNRVISEPPSHRECAEWSVKACPFLSKPRMRRNTKDIPGGTNAAAGIHIERNPGVMALWQCDYYKPFKTHGGILIRLGEPQRVDWWCQGRAATRKEVEEAILSGLPTLTEVAMEEGTEALEALNEQARAVVPLMPRAGQDI